MIYYLKYDDSLVPEMKDADYIRMIMPPDSASTEVYPVYEFYRNGKRKLIAASHVKNGALEFEGSRMTFYPNGTRQSFGVYKNGELTGELLTYYPNGKLYTITTFDKSFRVLLLHCRDSLGKVLADKGTGDWFKYNDNFDEILAKGSVKNGLEHGEWSELINDSLECTYIYNNGKLISGKSFKGGVSYPFKEKDTPPFYKGGNEAFVSTLFHYVGYKKPVKGVMTVRFTIEANGKITNPSIVNGLNPELDEQTLKALKSLPPWKPGLAYGIPIRTNMTSKIDFNIFEKN